MYCIVVPSQGENVDIMRTHRAMFQPDDGYQVRIYCTPTFPDASLNGKKIIAQINCFLFVIA